MTTITVTVTPRRLHRLSRPSNAKLRIKMRAASTTKAMRMHLYAVLQYRKMYTRGR